MSTKKTKKRSSIDGSNKFDPESIVMFREMPLEVAIKILKDSGVDVSEEEASEILSLLHTIAKITIKEFLVNQE